MNNVAATFAMGVHDPRSTISGNGAATAPRPALSGELGNIVDAKNSKSQKLVVVHLTHLCGFWTDKTKVQYTAVWSAAKIVTGHVFRRFNASSARAEKFVGPNLR